MHIDFDDGVKARIEFRGGTEAPVIWGWSHVPYFGGVVEGNVIEDPAQVGILGVEHGPYLKSNKGRTYMTISLRNNTVRWTDAYLKRVAKDGPNAGPKGMVFGYPGSLDPGELVVREQGDRLQVSSGARPREVIRSTRRCSTASGS